MNKSHFPWDSSPDDADLPVTSLKEHFNSVSELSVAPDSWYMFSPSQTLALMHSHGMLHGDLHREHMFFDSDTGHSLVIDFATTRHNENLDPRECAVDFAAPYMSLSRDDFHAFLAGYINVAQTYVDSLRAGFTQELLEALGTAITNYVGPRENSISPRSVLASVGITFSIQSGRLKLVEASGLPSSNSSADPREVIQTLCGLIVCGIDCTDALRKIESLGILHVEDEWRSRPAILSAQDTESTTARERVNPVITYVLATLKDFQSHYSASDAAPRPNTSELSTLAKCLSEFPREVASQVGDMMIDVTDALAEECLTLQPADEAQHISISFAQYSQMLLLMILSDAEQDEQRLATMLRRSYSLHWMTLILGREDASNLTLHELAFANSRSSVLLKAFQSSVQAESISNPRWSAIWRCLKLTQQSVLALRRLLSDSSLESHQSTINQIAPVIINKFGSTLTVYAQALMLRGKFDAAHSWLGEDAPMMKLLEATKRLLDILRESELTSAQARSSFDQMFHHMKIDRPFAFASMVKR